MDDESIFHALVDWFYNSSLTHHSLSFNSPLSLLFSYLCPAVSIATPLYLSSDTATATPAHNWHHNFDLAVERYRGLSDREDHLHAATFEVTLNPGESIVFVASTETQPNLDGPEALKLRHSQEQKLINLWKLDRPNHSQDRPDWIDRLVLAADQFIVDRSVPNIPNGKTIIAGACHCLKRKITERG